MSLAVWRTVSQAAAPPARSVPMFVLVHSLWSCQQLVLHRTLYSLHLVLHCSDVKDIDAEDKEDLAAFPFDEEAELASLGAAQPVGEKGFTTLERRCLSCILSWHMCNCNRQLHEHACILCEV